MIQIRSVVRFIANNRDKSEYIVREIRYNQKVLIESLTNGEFYLVSIEDIETI